MLLQSIDPELEIPKVNFYKYNADLMKKRMHRVALIDGMTGQQLTFGEILKGSVKLASAFTKLGLQKQEVVALSTSNCIEYGMIILGVAACNAITTTCNPQYKLEEALKQFEDCQPKIVITDSHQVDKMLEIAKRVPSIQEVISLDETKQCKDIWRIIHQDDGRDFPFNTIVDIHEDIVLLPYSSGTTGMPKGVMLTHYNLVSLLIVTRGLGRIPPWIVVYSTVPMFHAYGLMRIFDNYRGLKYIIDKRFNVKQVFETIEKHKVSVIYAVPAMMMQLTESPLLSKYDLSSLGMIASGAAPLAPKVTISSMQKMQAVVAQGWGLTECIIGASISMINSPLNTVGFNPSNSTIKVVDQETRKELGPNQDGELLIKAPQVMKGYYKNPKANAEVFEDGFLCTGDIGHFDDDGLIYIVDRMKELIKYKGFQVAPAELESIILELPKVADVGVVGVDDLEAGEVPRAFVVKRDPSLTTDEVKKHVEAHVSKYKYLRGGVVFIDQIPRSTAGKILRRKLKIMPVSKL